MKNAIKSLNGVLLILLIFSNLLTISCKKEPLVDSSENTLNPTSAIYEIQPDARDSAYFWIKDYYLWNEVLPSFEDFQPRALPDIFAVMNKVRSYQPLDRFSFVERKSDPVLPLTDIVIDMGFSIKYFESSNDLRVNFVNPDSPSGLAGVKRGWRILKIDGTRIGGGSDAELAFLNDVFRGTTPVHSFTFQKLDNSVIELLIREGVYRSRTVLFKSVFQVNTVRIGYLVYNQFGAATSVAELQNAFAYFESEGISDLIVDLRYNRGGFTATAEALANLLAPQQVGSDRQVMFRYVFNNRHPELSRTINFRKTGSLNLSRILFIVTPSTASASEVLINSLKPVMEVKLLGERHTYGKPVGFFPISVYEYNIYPVSFKIVNSAGNTDYYRGFPVDLQVRDDLAHQFGDPEETCLNQALSYLRGSSPSRAAESLLALGADMADLNELNDKLDDGRPAIMVENRTQYLPKLEKLR